MSCNRVLQLKISRVRLLPLLFAVVLGGCAVSSGYEARRGVDWYKVRSSDTLYSIAWRYGLDHQSLARWNGLSEPYTIYPGQQLILTKPKKVAKQASSSPSSSQGRQTETIDRQAVKQSTPGVQQASRATGRVSWRWPTEGKLLNRFSFKDISRRGIDIAGKIGQPVQAVANGKVVYSGTGLASYGNLIIVKHNETFLSAYAFNRKALVREGQKVRQGEPISEMGLNADNQPVLHFQIRKNGKPVDPLKFLPVR